MSVFITYTKSTLHGLKNYKYFGIILFSNAKSRYIFRIKLLDGPLKDYIEAVKTLSPEEAGVLLEKSDIAKVHDTVAEEGQTKVNLMIGHFSQFCLDPFKNVTQYLYIF